MHNKKTKPNIKNIKHIQQRITYYGSLDDTTITINADEKPPLLVDRTGWPVNNNYNENNKSNDHEERSILNLALSSSSFEGSHSGNGSEYSVVSTKSFKSHFMELKVLAFALILAAAISIAIYLLLIESRLPSITLSFDLVYHDIWSCKIVSTYNYLQHNNVDRIVLITTGGRNCGTPDQCLEVLKEMQINEPEELPYNFLIGGDGQVYEARGWKYQSNMKGIPQELSLVIGIIGDFKQSSSKKIILRTIRSLIQQSSKRRMINKKYFIYGLYRNDDERKSVQKLFNHIKDWPGFRGYLK